MTSKSAQVAVVARSAEWDLNDYAFRVPRDEVPKQEAFQLAERLVELAKVTQRHHMGTREAEIET